MIKVGLTGNIGTGKTVVVGIFRVLGIPVYNADEEAKRFLFQKDVIRALTAQFGTSVLSENKIDRKKLASIVFQDEDALRYINSIIHPLVRKDLFDWIEKQKDCPYIIQEAAILFESGFNKEFDKVITVASSAELSINRVMQRDKVNRKEVEKRMANQWDQERKIALSDFVIYNDEESSGSSTGFKHTPNTYKIKKAI